jgi:hypothetical protein
LQRRFTRDAALLQRVGQVLLQHPTTQNPGPLTRFDPRWLVAKDAFALADPAATQAIYDALAGPRFKGVQAVLGAPSEVEVAGDALAADGLQELSAWVEAFRITQVKAWLVPACETRVTCVLFIWCTRRSVLLGCVYWCQS